MGAEPPGSAAVGIPGAWQVLDLLEKQGGQGGYPRPAGRLGRRGGKAPQGHEKGRRSLPAKQAPSARSPTSLTGWWSWPCNTEDAYALTEPKRRSAPARYEVVNFLATAGRTPAAEVSYYTGASSRTLKTMEKAGLIAFSEEEELRVPSLDDVEPGPEIVLNEEQQRAFEEILGRVQAEKPSVTLLHGVTGSRQDAGLSALGAGNAGVGKNRYGAGAGDRADAADDAEIQLLLRQPGGHAPQLPENDGAL